jgi:hypothetical protein
VMTLDPLVRQPLVLAGYEFDADMGEHVLHHM